MYTSQPLTIIPLDTATAVLNPSIGVGWLVQDPDRHTPAIDLLPVLFGGSSLRELGWRLDLEYVDDDGCHVVDLSEPERIEGAVLWMLDGPAPAVDLTSVERAEEFEYTLLSAVHHYRMASAS